MPQTGIFALGTSSHAYLELDLRDGAEPSELVARLADLREPRTTIGGVNLVVGVRPELWRDRIGAAAPAGLHGFDEPVTGPDGFTMPATQHDARAVARRLGLRRRLRRGPQGHRGARAGRAVATETSSWPYRHDRDLTGFVDGTENPSLARAPDVALVPPARPVPADPCCCCSAGHTTSRPGRR